MESTNDYFSNFFFLAENIIFSRKPGIFLILSPKIDVNNGIILGVKMIISQK